MRDEGRHDFGGVALTTSGRNDGVPDLGRAVGTRAKIARAGHERLALALRVAREGVPRVPTYMIGTARLELRVEELESMAVVLAGRPTRKDGYAKQETECAETVELGLE